MADLRNAGRWQGLGGKVFFFGRERGGKGWVCMDIYRVKEYIEYVPLLCCPVPFTFVSLLFLIFF